MNETLLLANMGGSGEYTVKILSSKSSTGNWKVEGVIPYRPIILTFSKFDTHNRVQKIKFVKGFLLEHFNSAGNDSSIRLNSDKDDVMNFSWTLIPIEKTVELEIVSINSGTTMVLLQ